MQVFQSELFLGGDLSSYVYPKIRKGRKSIFLPLRFLPILSNTFNIPAVQKARNLGVIMDRHMLLSDHITKTCQSAIMAIRKIGQIRHFLNRRSLALLVHSLIISHVDNCNALFYGLPQTQMNRLQRIQNTAARLITGARSRDPISPVLTKLHWLPVEKRILFKILILCYKAQNCLSPQYLSELIEPYRPRRNLRSSSQYLLTVPSSNTNTYGHRAVSISAPVLWNSLPLNIRTISSFSTFKSVLIRPTYFQNNVICWI